MCGSLLYPSVQSSPGHIERIFIKSNEENTGDVGKGQCKPSKEGCPKGFCRSLSRLFHPHLEPEVNPTSLVLQRRLKPREAKQADGTDLGLEPCKRLFCYIT